MGPWYEFCVVGGSERQDEARLRTHASKHRSRPEKRLALVEPDRASPCVPPLPMR